MTGEVIITFPNTHNAIAAERTLLKQHFAVKVMPLPASIKAGCGICLRVARHNYLDAIACLDDADIIFGLCYQYVDGGFFVLG